MPKKPKPVPDDTGLDLAELERQQQLGADIELVTTLGEKAGEKTARRVPLYERWGRSDKLTDKQVAAAEEFRSIYETAEKGVSVITNYDGEVTGAPAGPRQPADAVLHAVHRRTQLRGHFGPWVMEVLTAFCVYDHGPEGSRWQVSREEGMIHACLEMAAWHFRI